MKILIVVHYFLPKHVAGTEILTYNLAKKFKNRGHDVLIFYSEPDSPKRNLSIQGGFYEDLQTLQIKNDYSHAKNLLDFYINKKIDRHFSACLDNFKPDVVHFQHLIGLSFGMIDECRKRQIPAFLTLHEFWLMCPHGQRYREAEGEICHAIDYQNCVQCMPLDYLNSRFLPIRIFLYLFRRVMNEKFVRKGNKYIYPFAANFMRARKAAPKHYIQVYDDQIMMHPNARMTYKGVKIDEGDVVTFKLAIYPKVVDKISGTVQFSIRINGDVVFERQMDTEELKSKPDFSFTLHETGKSDIQLETRAITNCLYCNVCWENLELEKKMASLNEQPSRLSVFGRKCFKWINKLKHKKNVRLLKKRERIIKSKLPLFEKIFAPTPFLHDEFSKWGMENLVFSEDGIETDLFKDFSKKRDVRREIRFAFIGTLMKSKGAHILIEAFNAIRSKNVFLDIYGDLNYYPDYSDKIRKLVNNKNIRFAGTFGKNKVADVFKTFDVLIVPSLWFENAPLVIRNAILAKTPVIATDLGGMNYLVRNGENGLTFPVGDTKALQRQIEKIISEPELIERYSLNMPVIKTVDENVRELEDYYCRVLKNSACLIRKSEKTTGEYECKASIVMLTYNGDAYLDDVLLMIRNQKVDFPFEVVIIDSGSTDRTKEIIARHNYSYHSIKKEDFNHGLTRNLGVSKARGEIIIQLTQDATPVDENWLATIVSYFDDKDVGGVYLKQIPRSNCNFLLAKRINEWNVGSETITINKIDSFNDYYKLTPFEKYQLTNFDDVCSAFRRSFWEQNPYQEANFAEDLRFGIDIILSGKKIIYTPDAQVIHSHNRDWRYEYRRTYNSHMKLIELYDFVAISSIRSLIRSILYSIQSDARFVMTCATTLWNKCYHLYYAFFLGIYGNLAQYKAYRDFQKGRIKNFKI